MNKPKEFFKSRFGSSENVNSSESESTISQPFLSFLSIFLFLESNTEETSPSNIANTKNETGDNQNHNKYPMTQTHSQSHSHSTKSKYTSDDESSSMTSGSGHLGARLMPSIGGSSSPRKINAIQTSSQLAAPDTAVTPTAHLDFENIVIEMKERREECHRLSEEVESMKNQLQNECSVFHQSLQEERYRFEVIIGFLSFVFIFKNNYSNELLCQSYLSLFPVINF